MKKILPCAAVLLLCALLNAPLSGLAFTAGCILGSPGTPLRWYSIVLGALAAQVTALLLLNTAVFFWLLLLTAAVLLALSSLWRSAALLALARPLLLLDRPEIYIALFYGVIWNAIFLFTYEKKYAIME